MLSEDVCDVWEISVKWNYKWKVNTVTDWWCFGLE